MGAARLKRTAGRQLGEVGGLARDRKKRLLAAEFGHRAEQGLGVGMLSIAEQVAHGAVLDDLPGIHYGHLVAHLGDDAEIVGDEDQRDATLLGEGENVVEATSISRLYRVRVDQW